MIPSKRGRVLRPQKLQEVPAAHGPPGPENEPSINGQRQHERTERREGEQVQGDKSWVTQVTTSVSR